MAKFKRPVWASGLTPEMVPELVQVLSAPRLHGFGPREFPVDCMMAIGLHGMNIVRCEAVYPVLHLLEIVTRNRVHEALRRHFSNDRWFELRWLSRNHALMVADARAKLAARGKRDWPDAVVAELSFGFWCGMFGKHYETQGGLWPELLTRVVPYVPKSWRTRDRIGRRLEEARKIRNRVFHHDLIGGEADMWDKHRLLVELLGWFSPKARQHLEHMCRFRTVMQDRLRSCEPVTPESSLSSRTSGETGSLRPPIP